MLHAKECACVSAIGVPMDFGNDTIRIPPTEYPKKGKRLRWGWGGTQPRSGTMRRNETIRV